MRPEAEWQLFTSDTDRAVVEKEIQDAGLSKREAATLQRLLDRIALGQVLKKDVKWLTDYKLLEARLDGDHRIFRLLFVRRGRGKVLVGVYFTAKKSTKLPKSVLKAAQERADEWDTRHTP